MGSVYLRENSWVVKYKDENDNWKRKSIGQRPAVTKTMAREVLKEIERKAKLGQFDQINVVIPTLYEFSKEYVDYKKTVEKKRSWRSHRVCLKNLCVAFGSCKLSKITPKDIDDYKKLRLKTVKPGTVDRDLAVLRNLFNLAKRWKKFYGENPVSASGLILEDSKRERIATPDEEKRLLDASPPHLRAILITALQTGMRKGEIIKLKWNNIDMENNNITIDKSNSKSKKTRKLPINTLLRRLLLEQKLKNGSSEYVFLTPKGEPYAREDSLNQSYRAALNKADIQGLRFHDLRHTAGTRLGEMGVPIQVIQEILGHADIRTTMRYVHPGASIRDAVEKLANSDSYGHKSGHKEGGQPN